MSNPIKIGLAIILVIVGIYFAIGVTAMLLKALVPIAVLAAIGLIIYGLISRKSLGGGGRSLP